MATQTIRVEYDLALPNEFLVDHEQTDGNTRTAVYNGPDKIYLQIGADGREVAGPLTEDTILDGRPMPADCVEWFEVDCATNPLLCQLRGPVVNELQEEYTGEMVHPQSPAIDGYPQFTYATPILPEDVYDKSNITVDLDTNEITIPKWSVNRKMIDRDEAYTWDDIREKRDQLLEPTDGRMASDMPAALMEEWRVYRQKLRDFPATMQAAGVEPNIAFYMFPQGPDQVNANVD